jgi:hypothetical protein
MEQKDHGCKVESFQIQSRDVVRISINDMLNEAMAKEIAGKLVTEFKKKGEATIYLVWNCSAMTGYEPLARVAIQNVLKDYHALIGRSYLISDNKIVKAGGQVLSAFVSFDMIPIQSENDIKF